MNEQHLTDFCRFAREHVLSGDIDPTYPLLRRFYAAQDLDEEARLWRTLLYTTWYDLGSAEKAWHLFPRPSAWIALAEGPYRDSMPALPTGTERRGFRGRPALVRQHVSATLAAAKPFGGLVGWVRNLVGEGGERGWIGVRLAFQQLPHGGPWSSYKFADLLAHVHAQPITANDLGIGGGGATAGPIPGMVWVTGQDWRRCARDTGLQRELLGEARHRAVGFSGLDQLETSLCDYNSLVRGRYYLGHDIDQQMTALEQVRSPALWEARAVFPDAYRGEQGGWFGVRRRLKTLWRNKAQMYMPGSPLT